jgi:hypothetical protein
MESEKKVLFLLWAMPYHKFIMCIFVHSDQEIDLRIIWKKNFQSQFEEQLITAN